MSADLRRFTIGGSEAAAAAGVHPHLSAVMLWAVKTGRADPPASEALEWGARLEPLIIDAVIQHGYAVERSGHDTYVDPERPWLVGHPDGFCTLDPLDPYRMVLEAETAGQWAHRAGWADDVPVHYVAQAQVYMHLTGLDRTLIACLIGGQRLELREVAREQRAIDLLLSACEDFHRHLLSDTMPAPDASDSTRDALRYLYPQAMPETIIKLDRKRMTRLAELRIRRSQRDALDAQCGRLENELRAYMGDNEVAISPADVEVIRFTNVTTHRVDTTRLKRDRPEIAAEYTATTISRRFTIL